MEKEGKKKGWRKKQRGSKRESEGMGESEGSGKRGFEMIVLVVGLEGDKQDEPSGVCLGVSVRQMSYEQCLMNKCASE